MKRPRAILFDNDGVLSESEPLHWEALKRLLTELGLPFDESEIRALVGGTTPQILIALLDKHSAGWKSLGYDVDALALRKNDYYLELAQTKLRTYPGVIEGLQWCRKQGIRTTIVSNAKRREVDAAVRILGLGSLLDLTICRDDAARPKPDPAPYLEGAARSGVPPSECLAVEDSPMGLRAALLAGMPAAAVLTNFDRAAMTAPVSGRPELRPVWVEPTIAEFFEWVKRL
ncbi:MAG: HAD family hydrolase [Bdellovibrionota bacterium]